MQWAHLMRTATQFAQRGTRCSTLLFAASLMLMCASLLGCYTVKSKPEVVGLYELNVGHDRINLDVAQDGAFAETILWSSGKTEKRTGKWYWNRGSVSFDNLWIPKAFAPDYIAQADAQAVSNQPKYSEPGTWAVSAERHWGTVRLAVFPDGDAYFKMVSHPSR